MTLDRVCMSLDRAFATGMAYVALSRGRELPGIQIISWKAEVITASAEVIAFYRSLPSRLRAAQGAELNL